MVDVTLLKETIYIYLLQEYSAQRKNLLKIRHD